MDFIKNAMGNNNNNNNNDNDQREPNQQNRPNEPTAQKAGGGGGGGFLGGFGDKLNSAAGGGRESEKNEDYLDKGIDAVQQYGLGQGDQSNESALEQAKDEQISDAIRREYKSKVGSDLPIKDKETRFG